MTPLWLCDIKYYQETSNYWLLPALHKPHAAIFSSVYVEILRFSQCRVEGVGPQNRKFYQISEYKWLTLAYPLPDFYQINQSQCFLYCL